jgi:5-methylcytosine-specific restriction endonuclease McrA
VSHKKKQVRAAFRDAVFRRDGYRCVLCHMSAVDAHHITDRHVLPNGGYVPANGISLCADCHVKAESFHARGQAEPGYAPHELYAAIGSTYEAAYRASLNGP